VHVLACAWPRVLFLAALGLVCCIGSGQAKAALLPAAQTGTELTPYNEIGWWGAVIGMTGDGADCFEPDTVGECSSATIDPTVSGFVKAVITWPTPPVPFDENDLNLFVYECLDPIELNPITNTAAPVQVPAAVCTEIAKSERDRGNSERVVFPVIGDDDETNALVTYQVVTVPFEAFAGQSYAGCAAYASGPYEDASVAPCPDLVVEDGGSPPPPPPPTDDRGFLAANACGPDATASTSKRQMSGGGKIAGSTQREERFGFRVEESRKHDYKPDGNLKYRWDEFQLKAKKFTCAAFVDETNQGGDKEIEGQVKARGIGRLYEKGHGEESEEDDKRHAEHEARGRYVCFEIRADDNGEGKGSAPDTFQIDVYPLGDDGVCRTTQPLALTHGGPVTDGNVQYRIDREHHDYHDH
jgi:hypothetical protein